VLLALAEQHGLTSYDAAYLSLAQRNRLPLATLDDDLRKAAAIAGVPLVTA
jgi:predicted nucleic acid-binding protein